MTAIVNIGLLLEAMKLKGFTGVGQAATACHVSEDAFKRLLRGEVPRLDCLFRISEGCGVPLDKLIIGASKVKDRPAEVRAMKDRTGT